MGDALGWRLPSRLTYPRKNAAMKEIPSKVCGGTSTPNKVERTRGLRRCPLPRMSDIWESNLMGDTLGRRWPSRLTGPRRNAARKETPTQVASARVKRGVLSASHRCLATRAMTKTLLDRYLMIWSTLWEADAVMKRALSDLGENT